ncbi:hypothetical protein [Maledivibacter halophilus]|uniref:Uncharacterized protein n=1 Tax=Maledivibacter halophilus TaxID=36842 RepID=A0A1T5IM53_9FIRM|nr:hypothetical protein [Maledivibacter halophilus]SKC40209.1 hypothetical protein SAMN02194393_00537 [Maledivibacter halophilus]
MNQYVSIEKINKDSNEYLKEGTKMSLVSKAVSIGNFNINISIKKDEEKMKDSIRKKIEYEQRVKKLLEDRDRLLNEYYIYDYMR